MRPISLDPYLAKLRDYYAVEQIIPSLVHLAALWSFKARPWAQELVGRMKTEHYLEDAPRNRLRPEPRFFERPRVDTVRAGLPEAAPEAPPENITIDTYLIDKPSITVLFAVRGDSMVDAAILNGDLVVVECRSDAKVGEIVLAEIDGERTLKVLAKDAHGKYLEARNPKFQPMRPKQSMSVLGVMVGVFRRTKGARVL